MSDSNPIQDSDISEMEPETSQTDNANVEVEENDLPKYINELDNLGNEDYSNNVSNYNPGMYNNNEDYSNDVSNYNPGMYNNKDYSNDVSDYNSPTNAYENKTALDQLNTSENEIDQPIDQPADTSINESEFNRFTNAGVVNTGVYITEPNQFTSTGEPDQLRYPHAIMDESRNLIENETYEETSRPVVYKTTETIQKVTSNGLDVNSRETVNEPKVIQKEIYEKKIETIWPANTNLYNDIEDDDDDDDDDDEIEEAKMIKIHDTKQQFRRRKPFNQQFQELSPSNNITSSNAHPQPNVRKYNPFKFFVILILITLFFYSLFGRKPSFIRKFADTTNDIFKEIDIIELPDINTINEHTVLLRRVANTIDRSPVFKPHGSQIATGLRDLGETIRDAGQLLRNMYSKGSSVHTSFDIEIEAMVQMADRLDLHHLQGDYADYFKERLTKLVEKIKDFRQSVEKVHNSIIDAEKIKLDNEGNIEDGFREAEKKFSENEKYSVVISKTRNELEPVNGIFNHLRITADRLDKMRIMLKEYEDKLVVVSDELGDEGVKVTKSDLKYLQRVIDHSKGGRVKFDNVAQISD